MKIPDNALGNTAQWALRGSADLLPQSSSPKNGKYIQYFRIFRTFACVKISRQSPCPIMRCCLYNGQCSRKQERSLESIRAALVHMGKKRKPIRRMGFGGVRGI